MRGQRERVVPAGDRAFAPLEDGDPRQVGGYLLRARIGEGGMGSVYLSHTPGGRPLAVKVARPELAGDPGFRSRFAKEVRIASQVQGLYTASVIDSDPAAERPWLATAYVPAPSLAAVIAAQGPLPTDTVLVMMAGIAEALQAIHAVGIVHRDLKPANVIMSLDGPRVIDFGIARAMDSSSVALTRTGARIGTPAFMAPEQVRGRPLRGDADVFSLGALAFYAAVAELPFGGDAAVFHRITEEEPDWESVDPRLRPVLSRCLAKDPGERPAPADVLELCRRATSDHRLRMGTGWLPPTVTAEVTRYAQAPVPAAPRGHGSAQQAARRNGVLLAAVTAVALAASGTGIALALTGDPGTSRSPRTGTSTSPRPATTASPTASASPQPSSSSSAAPLPPTAGTSPSTSPGQPSPETSATGDVVRWHGRLDVIYYGAALDDVPPSVPDNAALDDISWTGSSNTLFGRVAEWTGPGTPTSKQCSDLVVTHPEGNTTVRRRGMRLCLRTGQGRGGYATVREIAEDHIALDLTVWELPEGATPSNPW